MIILDIVKYQILWNYTISLSGNDKYLDQLIGGVNILVWRLYVF